MTGTLSNGLVVRCLKSFPIHTEVTVYVHYCLHASFHSNILGKVNSICGLSAHVSYVGRNNLKNESYGKECVLLKYWFNMVTV